MTPNLKLTQPIFPDSMPVWLSADVVVCGGGTAGVFAAVAAANEGADVLLIESQSCVGGTPVNGLVTPLMRVRIDGEPRCSYLDHEVTRRLQEYHGERSNGGEFDPIVLGVVLEQLCVDSKARILLNTSVCGVKCVDDRISAVYVHCRDGFHKIEGKVFIDCTGDGTLAVLAGAEYFAGRPDTGINQPMSLRYLVSGIDKDRLGEFLDGFGQPDSARSGKVPYEDDGSGIYAAVDDAGEYALSPLFRQAADAGDLIKEDLVYWQLFDVPGRKDTVAFNNPEFFEFTDAMDPLQVTEMLLKGKTAIMRQLQFCKKYLPGCEDAYISEIAPMAGIRESRRIRTKYVLTGEDLIRQRKFSGRISQLNYPIDIHGVDYFFDKDRPNASEEKPWYEIPYDCLISDDLENLMIAGRCIGADFTAQSAIRIQIPCRSMGEAAGIGAALSVQRGVGPGELKGEEISARMIERGAEFKA